MKVFISSVIDGFGEYRDAAARAIRSLGFDVLRAEDLPAMATTPQRACLDLQRQADVTVLLLGERYGWEQPSGLSATHEEFRDVVADGMVLVFVQGGVEHELKQHDFIDEASPWQSGLHRSEFHDPEELRDQVTHALHRHSEELRAGGIDEAALVARVEELATRDQTSNGARAHLAIAGGPAREIVAPTALRDGDLERALQQHLMFEAELFDRRAKTNVSHRPGMIEMVQRDAEVRLYADGTVALSCRAVGARTTGSFSMADSAIVQEDLLELVGRMLGSTAWILDTIDETHRLRAVAFQVRLAGADATGWMTRAEASAQPSSMSLGFRRGAPVAPAQPRIVPRTTFAARREALAEDITARLEEVMRP